MRVLVLGSGVAGVCSAWYLAKAGFEVIVVDRHTAPAQEASFANAGRIASSNVAPWAAPGMPRKALNWGLASDAPFSIRPTLHLHQYCWLYRFWQNCEPNRFRVNRRRMMRLAGYSGDALEMLRAETGIQYEGRQLGTTQLFRTAQQLDAAAEDVEWLEEYGVPYAMLDQEGIRRAEPALSETADRFAGALLLLHDQTGDCRVFTENLAILAGAAGVEFQFGRTVQRLETDGGRITAAWIDGQRTVADHYVVALGNFSRRLLKTVGLPLPIYPLKGYSLTIPITDAEMAPMSTVLDETHKVAITRFDRRIRIGGIVEVGGYACTVNEARRRTLENVIGDLFPRGGDLSRAEFWTGLRPATPDGPPILGRTRYSNLFTNTGHGTLGWSMACGSGRYLADVMADREPEIDGEGLDASRYSR